MVWRVNDHDYKLVNKPFLLLTYRAGIRTALVGPCVEGESWGALHLQGLGIVAQEVALAVPSVGQEDQVLRVRPARARRGLHTAVGQLWRGALLVLLTVEETSGTVLLHGESVHALHKLAAGRDVGQPGCTRVGTRVDVVRDAVGRGQPEGGDGEDGKELHWSRCWLN